MSFLPENYSLPKAETNYFEFEDGENRFRILSSAVTGFKYWLDENKNVLSNPTKGCQSIYVRDLSEVPKPIQDNPNFKPKHFWAMSVYNGKSETIQVLKLTQVSIMTGMLSYINNPDWGTPAEASVFEYDFVVMKEGDGLGTKYTVMVCPKSPLANDIMALYQSMSIDLDAFYKGEDPMAGSKDVKEQVQQQPNGVAQPTPQANGVYVAL